MPAIVTARTADVSRSMGRISRGRHIYTYAHNNMKFLARLKNVAKIFHAATIYDDDFDARDVIIAMQQRRKPPADDYARPFARSAKQDAHTAHEMINTLILRRLFGGHMSAMIKPRATKPPLMPFL